MLQFESSDERNQTFKLIYYVKLNCIGFDWIPHDQGVHFPNILDL
jgi:hypothetical protein